jgi:hypothetical protein
MSADRRPHQPVATVEGGAVWLTALRETAIIRSSGPALPIRSPPRTPLKLASCVAFTG